MKKKNDCPDCHRGTGLALGPGFSRRRFMQVGATGLVASWFADVLDPKLLFARTAAPNVALRSTAKNCIFIFLPGAPSQIDTWDLKEGPWTPDDRASRRRGALQRPLVVAPLHRPEPQQWRARQGVARHERFLRSVEGADGRAGHQHVLQLHD